jgi:putative flippase GtrA
VRYIGLMLGGGSVNYAVYSLLAWYLPQTTLHLLVYVAAGSLAGMTVNYLGASRWLYRS